MKLVIPAILCFASVAALATGTVQTEQEDGTFTSVQDSKIVDGCIVTHYLDGTKKESFNGGKIIHSYYKSGKKQSSYNYNSGNVKFYVYDEETGARSEPKYESKY